MSRFMSGTGWAGLILLLTLVLAPVGLVAQEEGGDPPPPDSVQLRAEREIFAYPAFERRNPFKPLTAAGEGAGPRFEQMRLQGIVYSTDPGRSVASITVGGRSVVSPAGTAQSTRGGAAYLRVGERWGNVRIVEIRPDRVIVEVEEFGLAERREMRLENRSQGGSR